MDARPPLDAAVLERTEQRQGGRAPIQRRRLLDRRAPGRRVGAAQVQQLVLVGRPRHHQPVGGRRAGRDADRDGDRLGEVGPRAALDEADPDPAVAGAAGRRAPAGAGRAGAGAGQAPRCAVARRRSSCSITAGSCCARFQSPTNRFRAMRSARSRARAASASSRPSAASDCSRSARKCAAVRRPGARGIARSTQSSRRPATRRCVATARRWSSGCCSATDGASSERSSGRLQQRERLDGDARRLLVLGRVGEHHVDAGAVVDRLGQVPVAAPGVGRQGDHALGMAVDHLLAGRRAPQRQQPVVQQLVEVGQELAVQLAGLRQLDHDRELRGGGERAETHALYRLAVGRLLDDVGAEQHHRVHAAGARDLDVAHPEHRRDALRHRRLADARRPVEHQVAVAAQEAVAHRQREVDGALVLDEPRVVVGRGCDRDAVALAQLIDGIAALGERLLRAGGVRPPLDPGLAGRAPGRQRRGATGRRVRRGGRNHDGFGAGAADRVDQLLEARRRVRRLRGAGDGPGGARPPVLGVAADRARILAGHPQEGRSGVRLGGMEAGGHAVLDPHFRTGGEAHQVGAVDARGAADGREQRRAHQRSPSRRRIAEPVSAGGGSPTCSATRAAVSAAGSSRWLAAWCAATAARRARSLPCTRRGSRRP